VRCSELLIKLKDNLLSDSCPILVIKKEVVNQMKYIFTVVVLMMCLSACYEDSFEEDIVVTEVMEPERIVLSQVEGIVVDTSGVLIPDADVTIGDMRVTTDNDGSFLLFDVPIADNGTVISVSKANYIDNATRIFPKETLSHEVALVLVPAPISTSVNGMTGATVDDPSGVSIDIQPFNFLRNGQPYTDEVIIDIYWVDINNISQFPNGLQINEVLDIANNLEISALSNVSLGYISIEDEQGEKLEVNPDLPISVTLPARSEASNLSGEPQQLLIYDTSLGYWTVEGGAEAAGDGYAVEVTQFDWLAVGTENRAIPYCFSFSSATPDNAENFWYSLSQEDGSIVKVGQVSLDNTECLTVEADSELTLRIFTQCGIETLNQIITLPTSESTTAEISLDLATDLFTFDVTFSTCNNSEIPDNTVITYSSALGEQEMPFTDENFVITLDPCDGVEELLITAVNNNQIIALTRVKLEEEQRNYEEQLHSCDEPGTLTLDSQVFFGAIGRLQNRETLIATADNNFLISFEASIEGDFLAVLFTENFGTLCRGTVEILEYGEVGELIVGTYCSDSDSTCEFRSGNFVVKRLE
jgi:hypothetical protein